METPTHPGNDLFFPSKEAVQFKNFPEREVVSQKCAKSELDSLAKVY